MILFFDTSALVKFFHNELSEMVFVVADDTLLSATQSIGAKVINPISGPQVILPPSQIANDEK